MGTIVTNPKDLPEEIRRHEKAHREAVIRGLVRGAHRGRAIMTRVTPVDQGQLKNSWKVRAASRSGLSGGGGTRAGGGLVAQLMNDAPHAGIVELGARPHPVGRAGWDAIYEWARRHFGTVAYKGPGKGKSGPVRQTMRKVRGETGEDPGLAEITWAIAAKIKREGQKPTYFTRNALPEVRAALAAEVVAELTKFAARQKGKGKGKGTAESKGTAGGSDGGEG